MRISDWSSDVCSSDLIARALGARAVGIAGGAAKCQALLDLGFDAVADYKAPDFAQQLKAALPDGADVYFENVGGDVTMARSGERRVGKECDSTGRYRWSPDH